MLRRGRAAAEWNTDSLSALIVLGGGDGARLGGASKPDLVIRGRRALEWGVDLSAAEFHVCVVLKLSLFPVTLFEDGDPPKSDCRVLDRCRCSEADPWGDFEAALGWSASRGPPCIVLSSSSRPWLIWRRRRLDGVSACADGYRQNSSEFFAEAVSRFPASECIDRSMRKSSPLAELNTVDIEVPASWVADIDTPLIWNAQTSAMDGSFCTEARRLLRE